MTTKAVGPGHGWGWLMRAVNLGRNNPKAIFGAVAWVALIALVPSIIQVGLQYGLKLGQGAVLSVIGATTLLSIIVYPLLIGGLLRVIDAAENGRPTRAAAVFDTFRSGHDAGRLIGFGLLLTAIYIGLFLIIIYLFGRDFMHWYWNLITATQANPGVPPQIDSLPDGFGRLLGLGMLVAMFFSGVYAIGFGQVALAGRKVGEALGDGLAGTLKNVLPIVVLALIVIVGFIVLLVGFGLVAAILGAIGALIHPALAVALLLPMYFAMILAMYVVMFGVMYYMWRDICSDAAPTPAAPADQLQA
ncbi:MAG TPA: hypothetical protein VFI26_09135 [Lysobacter sp.]|nr:hypothetical protein [Lysobacter sp.]